MGWQSLQRQKADLEKLVPQQIKQAAVVKNLKKKITDDERSIEKITKTSRNSTIELKG